MSASMALVIPMAVMYAAGVYVVLERSLTRVIIGFLLIGNATNLLLLIVSGPSGQAPFMSEDADPATFADPLPQALILTAIVINFGVSAFLLALLYRSWWLARLGDEGDRVVTEHEDDAALAEEVFSSTSEDEDAVTEALDLSEEDAADSSRSVGAAKSAGVAKPGSKPKAADGASKAPNHDQDEEAP